jgi:hypothetical protein
LAGAAGQLFGARIPKWALRTVHPRCDLGIHRSLVRAGFFHHRRPDQRSRRLVYGIGGYLAIVGSFTVGTIVAFGSYLGGLYASLQGLANAPVEFATSVVSFERVFESSTCRRISSKSQMLSY